MHFNEQDRLVVAVLFYHCFGMILANLLCFSVGACVVIGSEHFDAHLVLTAIEKEKCTAIHGVPTMFIEELEQEDFSSYDLLFTYPRIAEVAVFGVPDARLGEQVAAWIQLHSGASASEEEIRLFCRDKIAHFKIPKYIRFVDEFPMTITGKLQKFKMREKMQKLLS
jgi:fatty-acyl-CoA synthase